MDGSSEVPTAERRSSRATQLTSICYTTFTAIAEVNMEVHAAQSAKEKCRPYQHYSASPKFGAQILNKNSKVTVWPQQHTSSFPGS